MPELARAAESFGCLLGANGCEIFLEWPAGRSWRRDWRYVVFEQSLRLAAGDPDRLRLGLNHLAFHVAVRRGSIEQSPPLQVWPQ